MDTHIHIALLADRHDRVEEILQIFPQFVLVNVLVFVKQHVEALLGIAAVPTGEREFAGTGIHVLKVAFTVNE